MRKIRILVVDDSAVVRRLLTDLLNQDPELEVVGMAGNGEQAISRVQQLAPDILTLDVEMPVMDGITTLRALRKTHLKLPIIMFSTLTEKGSAATMDALAAGASDYVNKPANVGSVIEGMEKIRHDLIPKIKALCHRVLVPKDPPPRPAPTIPPLPVIRPAGTSAGSVEVLAIGVSTGGPNALAELIPAIGRGLPVPIVIVQHMPPLFTRLLAERIATVSGVICREATDGETLKPGEILLAPGGKHLEVEKFRDGVRTRLQEEAPENSCRPAVDVLFRSVAKVYGGKCLAVVLTGMGQDGLKGCELIRAAGGQILVQDEASSVVWGMPGAVSNAGLAEKALPLKELAQEICRRVQPAKRPTENKPAFAPAPAVSGAPASASRPNPAL
jgi:two-component system chemotaxis response regulator CheB